MRGFDILQPVGGIASDIAAAGYQFVGRYLKNLTPDEVRALSDAGLKIVSIWERGSGHLFDAQRGREEGALAAHAATILGQPPNTAIIAAVDYDAETRDLTNILAYFVAFEGACAPYRVGAYGSGLVLTRLAAVRIITERYLAGAMGWHDSRDYDERKLWTIRQYPTITEPTLGIEVDPCETASDSFGGWSLPAAGGVSGDMPPAIPSVIDLQRALNAAGIEPSVAEDGIFGPETADALGAYYRDVRA